jgi:hypothetical protein
MEKEEKSWVQKARESYYLQLTLAARLSRQASLGGLPGDRLPGGSSLQEICGVQSDSETVSYRLWVNFPFFYQVNSLLGFSKLRNKKLDVNN